MGTTSQKLEYLNGTKSSLKTAINNLGGDITSSTTFRNYATELNDIYNNLPKVSDTGTNVSLSPTLKGRLGIVPKGNTLQDGTPTPSAPVEIQSATGTQKVVVSGKNSYDINNFELSTWDTGGGNYSSKVDDTIKSTSDFTIYRSKCVEIPNLKSNTDYTLSGSLKSTNTTGGKIIIYGYNGSSISSIKANDGTLSVGSFSLSFNTSNYTNIGISFNGVGGSGTKETIFENIMISTTGGEYQPYQEPQEVDIELSSRNLFDKDNTVVGWIRSNNGTINPESGSHTSNFIKIKPNTNYIRTTREGNAFYDENKEFISYTYGNNYETPNNAKYIRITVTDVNINQEQLEYGTTATDYTPYYNYSLNKIGDYEDYIDGTPDNWVLYKNIGKVVLNGSENWTYDTAGGFNRFSTLISNSYVGTGRQVCLSNYFKNNLTSNADGICFIVSRNVYLYKNDITTANDFKTWLSTHNTEVLYVLAETQQISITEEPLVSQLNELYYLMSYNDTTNIDVTGNLPMRITASAIKGA